MVIRHRREGSGARGVFGWPLVHRYRGNTATASFLSPRRMFVLALAALIAAALTAVLLLAADPSANAASSTKTVKLLRPTRRAS